MADWAPQMPPELMQQALMRRPGVTLPQQQLPGPLPMTMPPQPGAPPPAPINLRGPGATNLAPPGPPGVGASGIPFAPPPTGASIPPPSAVKPPPQPSDDPGISPEMRKALQPTQDASAALAAEGKKYQGLSDQMGALKPPSYEDYKPPLWKKIAAPFVGALAGREAAGPAVSGMLYGPYERAQQGYETQKSKLQQQLEAERGIGIPLAESQARVAQEGVTNTLNARKEAETEKRDTATEQYKSDLNEIRTNISNDKLDEAQKKLDETAEKNKNNFEMQNELLKVRQELADAAKERDKAKSDAQTGWTPSESREISQRNRPMLTRINALEHSRAIYVGSKDKDDVAQLAAIDKEITDQHAQIDAVEKDVESRRTKPGAVGASGAAAGTTGGFQVPKGAPAPTKPGHDLRDTKTKKIIAHSVDGKTWGPPQ
jgi:hypothetical protein